MKINTPIYIIFGFLVTFALSGLKAKNQINQYLANGDVEKTENKEEVSPSSTEVAPSLEKPIPQENAEECANTLNSNEKERLLIALFSCAEKNKDNQKIQSALLNLIQNSQDEDILKKSLLLLSNQKNKEISKTIISVLSEKESFKKPKLQYTANIVLYSTLSDEVKNDAKQIYENQQSSEDVLLKNLSENVLKKLNK